MSRKLRVAVIGLGSTGSMALWHLSQREDIEAIGIEQFGVGHGYGAYTGESRLFRSAYHEGKTYVPLLQRARELWRTLGDAAGRQLLFPVGVLSVGREDEEPFQRLLESVADYNLPHERLDADAMRRRYPGMDFEDDEGGVLDLLGGALRPELSVLSAVEQAKLAGATVLEHTAVTEIDDQGDQVVISTETESLSVDRVIVTTGAWSALLVPEISDLIEIRKLVLTWFLPRKPADFSPDRMPCFIRDRDGFHIFGAPSVDGYSVKIAGLDLWGGPDSPRIEDGDLRLDRAAISEFGEKVVALFPGVMPEPNRYSVHYDTYTSDKYPIIDRRDSVVVLTGGSGHGFKLAPAYGEIAVDLAVDGTSPLTRPEFAISAHRPIHAAV